MENRQRDQIDAWYRSYSRLCFSLAYRMLGSVSDAEDVVQDVFVQLSRYELSTVINPKAFMVRIAVNRSRDILKSSRKKREEYVGPWLPEPLLSGDVEADETSGQGEWTPENAYIQNETVSFALLTLLHRLNPVERAVFLLREAFAFDYAEVVEIIGKSEANCRKIHSRTKEKLPSIEQAAPKELGQRKAAYIASFLKAASSGDLNAFVQLLADDAVLYSDGGGKVSAAVRPLVSRDIIAAFFGGLMRKAPELGEGFRMIPVPMGTEAGLAVVVGDELQSILTLQIDAERVRELYLIRNPDKLAHAAAVLGLRTQASG